eukprot:gene27230-2483_t
MSNCTLHVKKLSALDAFTSKSIILPKTEVRSFLGELSNAQSTYVSIIDEQGREWEMLCTCYNNSYHLSRIGMFCHVHNLKPGSYLIFFRDCKHKLHLVHLQQERLKRAQNQQLLHLQRAQDQHRSHQRYLARQMQSQADAWTVPSPSRAPPPSSNPQSHVAHLRGMLGKQQRPADPLSPRSPLQQPQMGIDFSDGLMRQRASSPALKQRASSPSPSLPRALPKSPLSHSYPVRSETLSGPEPACGNKRPLLGCKDDGKENQPCTLRSPGSYNQLGSLSTQLQPGAKRPRKLHHLACCTTQQDVIGTVPVELQMHDIALPADCTAAPVQNRQPLHEPTSSASSSKTPPLFGALGGAAGYSSQQLAPLRQAFHCGSKMESPSPSPKAPVPPSSQQAPSSLKLSQSSLQHLQQLSLAFRSAYTHSKC